MKITKVKLDNQIVLMQRNSNEGYLIHGSQEKKQRQISTLLVKKQKNFMMSLIGKTLVKNDVFKCSGTTPQEKASCKQKQQNLIKLKQLFEYTLNPTPKKTNDLDLTALKSLSKEQLKEYLAHKFINDESLLYNKQSKSFNLLDDLYSTLQQNKNHIESYKKWADWFIENKQLFLTKSIINNKIKASRSIDEKSKRQQVLDKLAEQMVNSQMSFDGLFEEFTPVISQWRGCFSDTTKYTQQDVDNKALKAKDKVVGYPKDFFEFKRSLKKMLKDQQTKQYQAGKFENELLQQYSLELTKYLERYFPLKKSARRLTVADIEYYLNEQTVKTTIEKQLKNATMQYLLQQGKYLSYQLGEQITSQDLQRIKIQEAFTLQFTNACGFAASNLRNIIDSSVKNDLLTEKAFVYTFGKVVLNDPALKNSGIHRLAQFLFSQSFDFDTQKVKDDHDELIKKLKSDQQYLSAINTIRCAIYAVRNNVIHFNHHGLAELFQTEKFTPFKFNEENKKLSKEEPVDYTQQALLLSLFHQDLDRLNIVFAEKIRTTGIIDFYNIDEVATQLKQINLSPKPLAFIPGFKKVFKWGLTYQQESTDYLNLSHYFEKNYVLKDKSVITDNAYQAQYNLLAIIYEQQFIESFLDNRNDFLQAVNAVLAANKKRAVDKPKKADQHKQAFSEISPYKTEQTPQDYLRNVQAQLINEENKKRDVGKLEADQTGHYQQFIWQLFVKGFDDFLTARKDLDFIHHPLWQYDQIANQPDANWQHQQVEKLSKNVNVSSQIKPDSNSQLAFWLFCKMLDANYLNQLHNQFSKWQQAQQNIQTQLDKDISVFQQIISLVLLTSDITPANYLNIYKTKPDYFNQLQPFTLLKEDKLKNKVDLFVQSDGQTPIIHGAIEQTKKYATYRILSKLLEQQTKFKISGKDIDDWERVIKEGHPDNPAKLSQHRQQLHLQWAQSTCKVDFYQNKTDKKKTKGWLNSPCQFSTDLNKLTNGQYYQQLCHKLEQYNWLDNKLHFVYIRQIHNLLIDILARLAGFINLIERDFQFLDHASSNYRQDDPYRLTAWVNFWYLIDQKESKNGCEELKKISSLSDEDPVELNNDGMFKKLQIKRAFYQRYFFCNNIDVINIRNYIAHFNYLDQFEGKKSVLDLIADVRQLLSYDRKLKNAVAKSFIDLFDRHGMTLCFKPLHEYNHIFKVKSIKSKKIKHLAGGIFDNGKNSNGKTIKTTIETDQVHANYIDMVKALLILK
ncbi:type VI-A CRISPR-associated RNA-guided ribonuclease Cas13a [Orbus wheelerorum]|uniref:type VI-A CRISPR-associated RNA-guided ribonuclease Cas13a n=1 Tax=Orbus wheelerorum TaxID=3074111 RepID=UPI00370D0C3F